MFVYWHRTERCNEDDSDTFGSLGPASRNLIENMPTRDEGEKLMDRYESRTPRRHLDPILFTRQIKDFLKERKVIIPLSWLVVELKDLLLDNVIDVFTGRSSKKPWRS